MITTHLSLPSRLILRGLHCLAASALLTSAVSAQTLNIDFEDLPVTVPPAQSYSNGGVFYNGSDETGQFVSRGANFENNFTDTGSFTFWSGWAYSTTTDTTTRGFGNQYSAIPGSGADGSATYGVFYQAGSVFLPSGWDQPLGAQITNTTYTYWDMLEGSGFSKAFGGESGNDPDFFRLTIRGFTAGGVETGAPVEFFLADYRFADNSENYVVDTWETVDLQPLGAGVRELRFFLDSSDNDIDGGWMNTPAYFAMDDLVLVPEPGAVGAIAGLLAIAVCAVRRRNRA